MLVMLHATWYAHSRGSTRCTREHAVSGIRERWGGREEGEKIELMAGVGQEEGREEEEEERERERETEREREREERERALLGTAP
jgi:hypothetical protein